MNLSKRVIILNRVKSPQISQAIFILRDTSDADFSAVDEAERIVDEYLLFNSVSKKHGKKALFVIFAAVVTVVVGIFIALR